MSVSLKEAIAKAKRSKDPTPLEWRDFLISTAKSLVDEQLTALVTLLDETLKENKAELEKKLSNVIASINEDWARKKPFFKGDPGSPGKPGKNGKSIIGPRGPRGRAGLDGEAPSVRDVADVVARIIGKPKDGSPDTPAQIVTKLQSLKGNRRLDKSAVKGLEAELTSLSKEVRTSLSTVRKFEKGGGGGMGNVQQEVKNVSSATTSITSNYPIMRGIAIWADYQGQTLSKGTHFTVNADKRTMPLLFTPDDATTIQLIYIRG